MLDFDELARLSPEQVAGLAKLERGAGGNYRCICPERHSNGDRNPSLSLSRTDGRTVAHCFGCGGSWSVVQVLAQRWGTSELETAERAGLQLNPTTSPEPPPIPLENILQMKKQLSEKDKRLLKDERAITRDIVDQYQLGKVEDRIAIPIFGEAGQVLNVRKYLPNSKPGQDKVVSWAQGYGRDRLYPLDQLDEAGEILVCEGEPDVLAAISWGFTAITNTCGAGTWSDSHSSRFAGKKVVILMDNDEAGDKGADKRAHSLTRAGAEVRIAAWPLKVGSSQKRGEGWDIRDELVKVGPESLRSILADAESVSGAADWTEPIPFGPGEPPVFPFRTLPKALACWVEAESIATQTPIDLPGVMCLAACAVAVAGRFEVKPKPDWTEPCNLYLVIALPSGLRKSAVFRSATRPIRTWEVREQGRRAPEISRAHASLEILKLRQEQAKRGAVKAQSEPDKRQAEEEAYRLQAKIDSTRVPAPFRILFDDITPEKLATELAKQEGIAAIMSSEGEIFELLAGRYQRGIPNLNTFLKAHAGDDLRIDRKDRSEVIERPCLTLGLTTQPEVIQGLAEKPGFRGKGVLARILFSVPRSNVGYRRTNVPAVPDQVRANYEALVDQVLEARSSTSEVTYLRFASDALATFDVFRDDVEVQLRDGGKLAPLADWGSKLSGAVSRLAGILHVFDYEGKPPLEIPLSPVLRAIDLGVYFETHARIAFQNMGADSDIQAAQRMLRWVEATGVEKFTKRDLNQALKGTFKRVSDLTPGLNLLMEHGYIREQRTETKNKTPGRKPSPTYEVNPAVHSHNPHNPHNYPPEPNSEDCEDQSQVPEGEHRRESEDVVEVVEGFSNSKLAMLLGGLIQSLILFML